MPSNSPNAKAENSGDTIKKVSPYITGGITVVGAVVTFLRQQTDDKAFWLGALLFVVVLAGLGVFLWFATKVTQIMMPGTTIQTFIIRRFPKWHAVLAWAAAGVLLAAATVVRYGFRDELFELAMIDRCSGNALIMDEGKDKFREGVVYRLPALDAQAYPAVTVIVAHKGTGRVTIDSVKLLVETLEGQEAKPIATSVFPDNETMPNLYVARLSHGNVTSEARLYSAGSPTEGLAYVEETKPIAKLHIGLSGHVGVYRVQVELTLKNADRTQVVRSTHGVYVIPQRQ